MLQRVIVTIVTACVVVSLFSLPAAAIDTQTPDRLPQPDDDEDEGNVSTAAEYTNVSGRMIDGPSGDPVPNGTVAFYVSSYGEPRGLNRLAHTNGSGHFSGRVESFEDYDVVFYQAMLDVGPGGELVPTENAPTAYPRDGVVDIFPFEELYTPGDIGEVHLPRGILLDVRVEDQMGAAVEGATVDLRFEKDEYSPPYVDRNNNGVNTNGYMNFTHVSESGIETNHVVDITVYPPDTDAFENATTKYRTITIQGPRGEETFTMNRSDDSQDDSGDGNESAGGDQEPVLKLSPSNASTSAGGSVTYDIVLRNASNGVGAFENLTVSVDDTEIAGIDDIETDVGGSANTGVVDNETAFVNVPFGGDTEDNGTVTLATVTVSAAGNGTATLNLTQTGDLSRENGELYNVSAVSDGTIAVGGGPPPVVGDDAPTDTDGDGLYEDVNGNGQPDIGDVQALFVNKDSTVVTNNQGAFDFNGNGQIDIGDVQALFNQI